MSLEEAIVELTRAVIANTAVIMGTQLPAPDTVEKAEVKKTEVKKPAAKPAEATGEVTYESVKVPFLAWVTADRDKALAMLKSFGIESLKGAKPEQYEAIGKAIAKGYADTKDVA